MSAEVVDLAGWKADQEPHWSGTMRCLECGHTHIATAPAGATQTECPECHTMKAVWDGTCMPETRWMCRCDNDLFFVDPDGCVCARCGLRQEFPE